MKTVHMRSFTLCWNGDNKTESRKVVAINFMTALKAAFGDNVPDITSVYSDEIDVYIEE